MSKEKKEENVKNGSKIKPISIIALILIVLIFGVAIFTLMIGNIEQENNNENNSYITDKVAYTR